MDSAGKGACWRLLYARCLPGPRGSIDQEWIAPIRGRREPAAISDWYTTCVKQSLGCSTLGFSAAMLTMVKSMKTLTKSVAVPLLDNQKRTQAGQGTWKCGLPAEFIDEDQMTLQELMSLKRMPHTTVDGNHQNRPL